jgi:hypothetical protein
VLLTRSPLDWGRSPSRVRLACVRHAASVDSEPGSNSQVEFSRERLGSQLRCTSVLCRPAVSHIASLDFRLAPLRRTNGTADTRRAGLPTLAPFGTPVGVCTLYLVFKEPQSPLGEPYELTTAVTFLSIPFWAAFPRTADVGSEPGMRGRVGTTSRRQQRPRPRTPLSARPTRIRKTAPRVKTPRGHFAPTRTSRRSRAPFRRTITWAASASASVTFPRSSAARVSFI